MSQEFPTTSFNITQSSKMVNTMTMITNSQCNSTRKKKKECCPATGGTQLSCYIAPVVDVMYVSTDFRIPMCLAYMLQKHCIITKVTYKERHLLTNLHDNTFKMNRQRIRLGLAIRIRCIRFFTSKHHHELG